MLEVNMLFVNSVIIKSFLWLNIVVNLDVVSVLKIDIISSEMKK